MEYIYKEEDINKVLAFLGNCPYAQVKPIVELLLNSGIAVPSNEPQVLPDTQLENETPTDEIASVESKDSVEEKTQE